jgi:DNA-directed RNA polymerase specialized sigma24 family protein
VFNFKKQYEIARTMVGELNQDFVHHCYLRIIERIDITRLKYPDTYFYSVMRTQVKEFMKMHDRQVFDEPLDDIETTDSIETIRHQLEQLKAAGFIEEVYIFERLATGMKLIDLSEKTGISFRVLKKTFNFVKNTILHELDNQPNT